MDKFYALKTDIKRVPKKYSSLLGCTLIMASLGSLSTISTLSPYYISYIREELNQTNVRYSKNIYIYCSQQTFIALSAITAGFLKNYLNADIRRIAFLGSIILSGAFALSFFTIKDNFGVFVLSQGVMFGMGYGLIYIVPTSICFKWFEKSKGLASSLIFLGNGLGSLFFNLIGSIYINPENLSPDKPFSSDNSQEKYFSTKNKELMERIPKVFLLISAMIIILNIIGQFLIFEKKEVSVESEKELIISNELETEKSNETLVNNKPSLTFKEAIRTRQVYVFALCLGFYIIAPAAFLVNYKNYGQQFIKDDKFLNSIAATSGILNIFTRLFWGWLVDKFAFRTTYLIIISSTIVLLLTVCLNELIEIKFFFLIWVFLMLACECGMLILMPNGITRRFGHKNLFLIYGIVQLFCVPSSFIDVLLTPISVHYGFFPMIAIACCFSCVAMMIMVCFSPKYEDGKLV